MYSASETCNFDMFQSCTLQYQATPSGFPGLPAMGFYSNESFPDPVSGGALFIYYLTCSNNELTLTRLYPTSPYGVGYQDGILYTWEIGGDFNTCSPFSLSNGSGFPGSDVSCCVSIYDPAVAFPGCT
jgi:hypothetical protein